MRNFTEINDNFDNYMINFTEIMTVIISSQFKF